jgi:SAM-dependent methyltransferase
MRLFSSPRTIHDDPVVESYIRSYVRAPDKFVARIDPDDEMFLFDLQANKGNRTKTAIGYHQIGARIFDSIKQIAIWHFGRLGRVRSFLDFASGYGRSTRFLSRELSPRRIWACDIYSQAIEFQKQRFGVNGIVSVADPADFPKEPTFDFIFASSFFTHMPEATFGRWLETLLSRLTEHGILAFSTHDMSLLPRGVPVPKSGILFLARSESRTLDVNQYGSNFVSEDFVARAVDRASGGSIRLHRIKRGLNMHQDIYILARHLNRDFTRLKLVLDPLGSLDEYYHGPGGEAVIEGWAADLNDGGSVEEVQVRLGGKLIESVRPDHDRPDIAENFHRPELLRSGWTCHLKRNLIKPQQILEVKVKGNQGRSAVIAYDYLSSMFTPAAAAG